MEVYSVHLSFFNLMAISHKKYFYFLFHRCVCDSILCNLKALIVMLLFNVVIILVGYDFIHNNLVIIHATWGVLLQTV